MNRYCIYNVYSGPKHQKLLLKYKYLTTSKEGNHIIIVSDIIEKTGDDFIEIGENLNLYRMEPLGWTPFRYNENFDYLFKAADDDSAKLIFEVN